MDYSLSFSCVRVDGASTPNLEEGLHVGFNLLRICKHVQALMLVHSRYSIQEVALEPQGNRRAWLNDCIACPRNVHALYGFAGDSAIAGFWADCSHQPGKLESKYLAVSTRLGIGGGLPDGRDAMLGARQN